MGRIPDSESNTSEAKDWDLIFSGFQFEKCAHVSSLCSVFWFGVSSGVSGWDLGRSSGEAAFGSPIGRWIRKFGISGSRLDAMMKRTRESKESKHRHHMKLMKQKGTQGQGAKGHVGAKRLKCIVGTGTEKEL